MPRPILRVYLTRAKLTGRGEPQIQTSLADESNAIRAPLQRVVGRRLGQFLTL